MGEQLCCVRRIQLRGCFQNEVRNRKSFNGKGSFSDILFNTLLFVLFYYLDYF